jgi:hypothetical protein
LYNGHSWSQGVAHAAGTLLKDMGQLVAKQLLPTCGLGVILSRGEVKVGAVGEGKCADRRRFVTDVDADVGEVGLEERLHLLLDWLG